MKKDALIILSSIILFTTSCGDKKEATRTQVLKLSHNHADGYPVDMGYKKFAELVKEKSGGRYEVEIYPSAILGDQKASVELAQSGVIHFGHINSAALEGFDAIYSVFNLPYVFKDYDHFRTVMDSAKVREVFEESADDKGFVTIMYLEGGDRNIYTKGKVVKTPADLAGLKIRVQDSPTHVEMIRRMGGTPVVMNFGEVYTGLQQGVIDGAENNAPSLVTTGHAEVAKNLTLNKHLRLSDFLVAGAGFWNELSEADKKIFRDSANETIEYFAKVWDDSEKESMAEAVEKYNVVITEIDTAPFRQLVLPLQDEVAAKDPKFKELLTHIRSLEK